MGDHKVNLTVSACAFIIGPLLYWCSCLFVSWNGASGFLVFLCGQVFFGIGVSMAAMTVGPYLAEIAPPQNRGAYGAVQEFGAVLGICISLCYAAILDRCSWSATYFAVYWAPGWLSAVVMLACLKWTVETPRACILQGRDADAVATFSYLCPRASNNLLQSTVDEIRGAIPSSPGTASELIHSEPHRGRLKTALGLVIFQTLTGESSMLYYSAVIIAAFSNGGVFWGEIALGLFKLTACLVTGSLVDVYGRRPLLTAGTIGLTLSTGIAAGLLYYGAYDLNDDDTASLSVLVMTALCCFVFSYDLSYGPQTWCLLPELFPAQFRHAGNTLALAVSSGSAFCVSLLISWLYHRNSSSYAMDGSIFAVLCLGSFAGAIFCANCIPETSGRTLEAASGRIVGDKDLAREGDAGMKRSSDPLLGAE